VQFDRQPVAVVIAESFEAAGEAVSRVRVRYEETRPELDLETAKIAPVDKIFGEPANHRRGDPSDAVFEAAAAKVKQTYRTPTEHHNPMEPHGTIAVWNGDKLTVHDSTQWAFGVRNRLSNTLDIDPANITVIAPFVGGAFGSKGTPWSHVPLAVMAAKLTGRPVKLLLTRPQMFGWVGHRPQTKQMVAIAAGKDGKLLAVTHDVENETSVADEFVEPSAVFSRDLYAVENYGMSQKLRRLNISKPTYQRGPGESTGGFAMESAMDELAYQLQIDPVELRLRNYSEKQPNNGKTYSSKHLRECYERAAEQFGWKNRNPKPRSMTRGRMLVGMGMSTASRNTHISACSARFRMNADGTVVIQCGTIEQGTGSSTVYGQLAAEILEIPYERVRFEWGNTTLPMAPLAAGSQTAGSVGSVVAVGAQQLRDRIAAQGNGSVPKAPIEFELENEPGEESENYATQAFGANFAEVEVDPDVGTVRVSRFVGAFDGGRILNAKTARSQFLGGVVWGISMALYELTEYDRRNGRIMNANLSEYLVPTNADIPNVELITVESNDINANAAHVRGIGEIGICGSAAAVANAVYHATGVRVRDLPIYPEKLIGIS
jgi:xanthine dehydrogenase YagR molybdenum-binding subunit